MGRLKIGSKVLYEATKQAKEIFRHRLVSCYELGSLAHGGFIAHVSDIDIGIIINQIDFSEDKHNIDILFTKISNLKIPMGDRLSIFWSSLESMKSPVSIGRFPLIDKFDLVNHGKLLIGEEIKSKVYIPTQQEIDIETTKYAVAFLGNEKSIREIKNLSFLSNNKCVRYVTKRFLFPVRFIYSLDNGEPGFNNIAVSYYTKQYRSQTAELVRLVFECRKTNRLPSSNKLLVELANKQLIPLYIQLIDKCHEKMILYKENKLKRQLERWKQELISNKN